MGVTEWNHFRTNARAPRSEVTRLAVVELKRIDIRENCLIGGQITGWDGILDQFILFWSIRLDV